MKISDVCRKTSANTWLVIEGWSAGWVWDETVVDDSGPTEGAMDEPSCAGRETAVVSVAAC